MIKFKKRKGMVDPLFLWVALIPTIIPILTAIFAFHLNKIVLYCLSYPIQTSIVISLTGIALMWYRSRHRITYGVMEVTFGFFSILGILTSSSTIHVNYAFSLSLIGCLYIIVRGLDNICNGIDPHKDTLPSLLVKCLNWLNSKPMPKNNNKIV